MQLSLSLILCISLLMPSMAQKAQVAPAIQKIVSLGEAVDDFLPWYAWLSTDEILTRSRDSKLYRVNVTTGQKKVVFDMKEVRYPNFTASLAGFLNLSPDHRSLFFVMCNPGFYSGPTMAGILSLNGGKIEWLPPFSSGQEGVWSPDSTQWVFTCLYYPNNINDTRRLGTLSTSPIGAKELLIPFSWAKGDEEIIKYSSLLGYTSDKKNLILWYTTDKDEERLGRIVQKDTTLTLHHISKLSLPKGRSQGRPLLSPNGKSIAWTVLLKGVVPYTLEDGKTYLSHRQEVWISDIEGKNWRCLWDGLKPPLIKDGVVRLQWLPDGSALSALQDDTLYRIALPKTVNTSP